MASHTAAAYRRYRDAILWVAKEDYDFSLEELEFYSGIAKRTIVLSRSKMKARDSKRLGAVALLRARMLRSAC